MEKRVKKISLLSCGAVGVAVAALLFFCDPSRTPIYPVCLFHRLTDLNCPGCGSLRAMHQLLHGNVLEALRLNALLVLSLPFFAWIGFRLLRQQILRTNGDAIRPAWLWVYAGIWVVFGIARELPIALLAAWSP